MPIYEYTCESCNKKFDQLVRTMSGDTRVKCPECGSSKTARAVSVFAVGAEGPKAKSLPQGGGCGQCGGPGPCSME